MRPKKPYETLQTAAEEMNCPNCGAYVGIGEPFVQFANGQRRCVRNRCGGPQARAEKPPVPAAAKRKPRSKMTEDELRQSLRVVPGGTGKRQRCGGHGYTGGTGFKNL